MLRSLAAALAALVLLAGCSAPPAPTASPAPQPASTPATGPAVFTDDSRLTPYAPETPIYTRLRSGFTGTLHPAPGYGPLLPYLGGRTGGLSYDGDLYGLMTLKGELVTDPVFADVWTGGITSGYHENRPLPYCMLLKRQLSGSPEGQTVGAWAMAAADGSWCTPFRYGMDYELTIWGRDISKNCDERGLFVRDGGALVYLDGTTGQELLRTEAFSDREIYDALFTACWLDGYAVCRLYDEGTSYRLDPGADPIDIGNEAYEALVYGPPSGPQPPEEAIETTPEGYELHGFLTGGGGWRWYREGENVVLLNGEERHVLNIPADPTDILWGRTLLLYGYGENENTVMTLDGKVLASGLSNIETGFLFGLDRVSGARYVRLPAERGYDFYDDSGNLLAHAAVPQDWSGQNAVLAGGLLLLTTDSYCGLQTPGGEWLFRWPLPAGEWD